MQPVVISRLWGIRRITGRAGVALRMVRGGIIGLGLLAVLLGAVVTRRGRVWRIVVYIEAGRVRGGDAVPDRKEAAASWALGTLRHGGVVLLPGLLRGGVEVVELFV